MNLQQRIESILEKSIDKQSTIDNIKTLIELEKYKQLKDLQKQLPCSSFNEYCLNEDYEHEVLEVDCYEKEEVDNYVDAIENLFLPSGYDSLIYSYELQLDNNLK